MGLRNLSSERGGALGALFIGVGVVVGLLVGLALLVRVDENIHRVAVKFVLEHERRTGQEYKFLRNVLALDIGYSEEEFWKRLRARDIEAVRILIQAGFNVSQARDRGETPLTFAVSEGLNDFIEMFLLRGADLNAANDDGATPLMLAIERQNRPLVERLLARKAESNRVRSDGLSPLLLATSQDDFRTVELLLGSGANMSYQDRNGRTPLHLAVGRSNLPLAKLFLERGANFNLLDAKGYSPLMVAVSTRNAPMVELLIQRGADPERRNDAGLNSRELAYQVGWVLTMTADRRVTIRERGGVPPPRDTGVIQNGQESEVGLAIRPDNEGLPSEGTAPVASNAPNLGMDDEELTPEDETVAHSPQLPGPDLIARSKVKVGDEEFVVPDDPVRPRTSNPLKYGIAPRGPSKQLTSLRVVGNPEGVWETGGQLVLLEVKVKVRNTGENEARGVSVRVRLPGGSEEGVSGPPSLKPGEVGNYEVKFKKTVKPGSLKAILSCENCD